MVTKRYFIKTFDEFGETTCVYNHDQFKEIIDMLRESKRKYETWISQYDVMPL